VNEKPGLEVELKLNVGRVASIRAREEKKLVASLLGRRGVYNGEGKDGLY